MSSCQPPNRIEIYRAYRITAEGRIFDVPTILEAGDDESAIAEAGRLVLDGDSIEIWDRGRLVATLMPGDQPI